MTLVQNILGNTDYIEFLRGKKATFLLALSNTATANIKDITQAGIPGKIYLTPTLDSEFVCTGEVRSLKDIAQTPKGVPTPALITRAVHLLNPFSNIELLDLGLDIKPDIKYFKTHDFGISSSKSIALDAKIDAQGIFQKGLDFGQNYKTHDDYIIIGESVPSGTTTAQATAMALGYDCIDKFSSSFKDAPKNIKKDTINSALEHVRSDDDLFMKLSRIGDNMIIFLAGFILGNNNSKKIVLAGGTQMACVLLVVNSILKEMGGEIQTSNLALVTTKWVYEDKNSDIKALLEMLDFDINAYYSDFDFTTSYHPALKLYDEGEAKEGVGAGGCLAYALINGIRKEDIVNKIESFLA